MTREHERAILALEREELERLRGIYEAARREILGRLADERAERFTAQHLRVSLAQIDAGLATMLRKLDERGARLMRRGLREGLAHTLDEIASFEPRFGAGPNSPIRLSALRTIAAPEGLLLSRYATSVQRYGAELRGDVQRRLSVHLVRRSFMRDVVQDVAGRLEASAVRGARWKAERIVRTELHHSLGAGNQAALEGAAEVLPGLKRQWDATLDTRTSGVCRTLNGQVRGIREVFVAEGKSFAHPPAHPNCRSRVLPWRAEWAELEHG
ncbi:MAG: phage minor head protein [Myxococcota bacterium]